MPVFTNPTTDELMSFLPLVDAEGYFPSGNNSCQAACVAPILGCTDPAAANFNPEADTDDGSCVVAEACPYENYLEYSPDAISYNANLCVNIIVEGCTENTALNYNP